MPLLHESIFNFQAVLSILFNAQQLIFKTRYITMVLLFQNLFLVFLCRSSSPSSLRFDLTFIFFQFRHLYYASEWIKEKKKRNEKKYWWTWTHTKKDIVGIFSGVTAHFERVHWINSQQQPTTEKNKNELTISFFLLNFIYLIFSPSDFLHVGMCV